MESGWKDAQSQDRWQTGKEQMEESAFSVAKKNKKDENHPGRIGPGF